MKPDLTSNDICFLFGAGASQHAGVPTMEKMWEALFDSWNLPDFQVYMDDLRTRNDRNIETLLKHLHETSSAHSSPQAMTEGTHGSSVQMQLRAYKIIEFETRKFVLHAVDHHRYRHEYNALGAWIPADGPLDIFSLNYDLVIEEFCSRNHIPLHDGFDTTGKWAPVSWPLATKGIRLWKLHGSINWRLNRKTGELTKGHPPRTFRYLLQATHAASSTADVELIWPAVYREFEGSLAVMREALFNKLSKCRALVIVGYRCSDPGVVSIIRKAYLVNPDLKTYIVCGSSGPEVREKLVAEIASASAEHFTASYGEGTRFPHILKSSKFTDQVQKAATNKRSHSAAHSYSQRHMCVEFICPGKFVAICKYEDQLILAGHESSAVIYDFDLGSSRLTRLISWPGSPRDLAISRDGKLLIADCRYCPSVPLLTGWLKSKSREGIGCVRIFDFHTLRFKIAGFNLFELFSCLLKIFKTFRNNTFNSFRQFALINTGILSWPTSVLDFPTGDGDLLVGEARNLTTYKPLADKFLRISGPRFFNLIGIQPWNENVILILEAALQNSGFLWKYDIKSGTCELLLAGIQSPGGFATLPEQNCVFISSSTKEGVLYKLDMKSRVLAKIPVKLNYPTKILATEKNSLFVLTSDAVVRLTFDLLSNGAMPDSESPQCQY